MEEKRVREDTFPSLKNYGLSPPGGVCHFTPLAQHLISDDLECKRWKFFCSLVGFFFVLLSVFLWCLLVGSWLDPCSNQDPSPLWNGRNRRRCRIGALLFFQHHRQKHPLSQWVIYAKWHVQRVLMIILGHIFKPRQSWNQIPAPQITYWCDQINSLLYAFHSSFIK